MARLCDDIEQFILVLLREQQQVDLQRNILAARFSCAPSQINYVLATRFTPTHGYRVESRRGGGGFVRVIRIDRTRAQTAQAALDAAGPRISYEDAERLMDALLKGGVISPPQARLMLSAVTPEVIGQDSTAAHLRAEMLKSMLACALEEGKPHAL